jgi:hypothetical protein
MNTEYVVLEHQFSEGESAMCTVRTRVHGEGIGDNVPSGNHHARIVGIFDRQIDAEEYAEKRAR